MNNIFAQRRSRLLAMKALRERYVPNEKAMTCPKCSQISERQAVSQNLFVCPLCGYHFPIGAYYRLSTILDSGSFRELFEKLPAGDPLSFPGYKSKLEESRRKTGLNEAEMCIRDSQGPGGVSADCTFHRDQGGHPHPALLHCRHLLWPGL